MVNIIRDYIVSCRHGGDTRYSTETILVGAKSVKDAINIVKREYKKHYHYTCFNHIGKSELKRGELKFIQKEDKKGSRLTYHPMRRGS